jgi:DNA-binding response OmpR family regulator
MKALRILVVDDNKDAARSLARVLKAVGHVVEVAFDGTSGIALATQFRPEVALLDIGLPDIRGFEVCKTLREVLGDELLAAFAITGWSSEEVRKQSFQSGFDQHFVKPIKFDELEAALSVFASASE